MADMLVDDVADGRAAPGLARERGRAISRGWPSRTLILGWASFALTLLVIFGTPTLLSLSRAKFPFDSTLVAEVAEADPDYIFIGNSMLGTRIDGDYLRSLVGNQKVLVLSDGGEMSALWFLRVKNHVAAAGVKPRVVFIMFRDDELTLPMKNISARNRLKVQKYSTDYEPEYDGVIAANTDLKARIWMKIEETYPIITYNGYVEQTLTRLAASPMIPKLLWLSALRLVKPDTKTQQDYQARMEELWELQNRTNRLFGYANMRDTYRREAQAVVASDFASRAERSFLPHILNVAKQSDIPLAFIRVERRPTPDGPVPQSPELQEYARQLRAYVETSGAYFYDFTGDPEITSGFFLDGDHIDPQYKDTYTRIFRDRLAMLFQRSEQANQ